MQAQDHCIALHHLKSSSSVGWKSLEANLQSSNVDCRHRQLPNDIHYSCLYFGLSQAIVLLYNCLNKGRRDKSCHLVLHLYSKDCKIMISISIQPLYVWLSNAFCCLSGFCRTGTNAVLRSQINVWIDPKLLLCFFNPFWYTFRISFAIFAWLRLVLLATVYLGWAMASFRRMPSKR